MSTFSNTALTANPVLTSAATDVFGFGATLNPDGSLNAVVGAVIRYVTVAPTQADPNGSLALRSDGTLYSRTGGAWLPIGGGGVGWNLPDNVTGIWGTTAPLQATSVYTSATKLWGLTSANWSSALVQGGLPGSVGFTFSTGTTTNTGAVVGWTSGGYAWATGATAQTTAAGTGGASGGYTWATGASTVNLAAGGATGGASGGYGWTTGNTDATGAAGNTAGVSGGFAWATGNTDNNSTGGFGANSGGYNFATGNCLSGVGAASGTSGSFTFGTGSSADLNTGGYTWTTGNATAGNSGGFVFTVGTAGGTRGLMDWNFTILDTVTQAFFWDLNVGAAGLTMRAGAGGVTVLTAVTTGGAEAFNFAARVTSTDAVTGGLARVMKGSILRTVANATVLQSGAEAVFAGGFIQLPIGSCKVGTRIRFTALVRVEAVSTAPTAELRLRIGAAGAGGTLVFDTTARTVADEDLISLDGYIDCITTGAPGTATGQCTYRISAADALASAVGSEWAQDLAGTTSGAWTVAMTTNATMDVTLTGQTDAAGTTLSLASFRVYLDA